MERQAKRTNLVRIIFIMTTALIVNHGLFSSLMAKSIFQGPPWLSFGKIDFLGNHQEMEELKAFAVIWWFWEFWVAHEKSCALAHLGPVPENSPLWWPGRHLPSTVNSDSFVLGNRPEQTFSPHCLQQSTFSCSNALVTWVMDLVLLRKPTLPPLVSFWLPFHCIHSSCFGIGCLLREIGQGHKSICVSDTLSIPFPLWHSIYVHSLCMWAPDQVFSVCSPLSPSFRA